MFVLFALPLVAGCAGMQTVRISTTEPAEIWNAGERICEKTPCTYTYARQGCGFPRIMATNRLLFEARTKDGRTALLGAKDYCDVDEDWHISIPAAKPASLE